MDQQNYEHKPWEFHGARTLKELQHKDEKEDKNNIHFEIIDGVCHAFKIA
jgi:hypothetical protein